MADFLYGKLNKTVEYLRYKFNDTTTAKIIEDDNHNLSIDINTSNLVTLKLLDSDGYPEDDIIKRYQLFAKDPVTGQIKEPLGDPIVVGETGSGSVSFTSIMINGYPVESYIDQTTGQLNLAGIPASAIVDVVKDPGSSDLNYVASILDGNARGEVY